MKKIIILAGNFEQFNRALEERGLTDREAVYGYCPNVMRGIEASEVIEVGTFYEHPRAFELREEALYRVRQHDPLPLKKQV